MHLNTSEKMVLTLEDTLKEIHWARGLHRDLLISLPEEHLSVAPIAKAGTWGQVFRHIGRVQENYLEAMRTGKVVFSTEGCTYNEPITKDGLLQYLDRVHQEMMAAIPKAQQLIEWPEEKWSLQRHLRAFSTHEIFHHGQFVLFARVSEIKLPKSWEAWGES